ncbi:uncharacterized protein LOC110234280 [Exaiptasia diaphana]|uniref:Uncharacterized protein n=1 Tax=Exaiptasia diaphana TaxID=2652724 RepID=A0A913WWZ4_EXADI|nr:uncharacterized protein LOC110234280 [Exaiptasia diaphana]
MSHLQNIHKHQNTKFKKCTHKKIKRQWFKPGAEDTVKLSEIIESTRMRNKVAKLSPLGQTSSLEGYHSIVNQFCPKMIHFSYNVMYARIRLAALHFNENTGRPTKRNKEGHEEYSIKFPKAKKGGHTVVAIPINCTYAYVENAFEELFSVLGKNSDEQDLNNVPPEPMCSKMSRPVKEEAVKAHTTRY